MFDGSTPVFLQVADYFKQQILEGTLHDNDQLTSTAQFAAAHKINPGTVTKAFAVLVDEGLVVKQRGIGMFVAPGARHTLRNVERERFFDDVFIPAIHQAHVLGIPETELLATVTKHTTPKAPQPDT